MASAQPVSDVTPIDILLVDDEAMLREPLSAYLAGQGFVVAEAGNAAEARRLAEANRFAIALCDVMMPGEDGLSLARSLIYDHDLPVILLTARGEADERVEGLELGADDYIVKPFEPRELVARIRVVLKRAGSDDAGQEAAVFAFDGWRFDPSRHLLHDPAGAQVPISTAEQRMLTVFLERAGQVLDRDTLLDAVQGREAQIFDRAVDNQVSRLRRKIEEDSRSPRFIQTVRGGGYRFAVPVERRSNG